MDLHDFFKERLADVRERISRACLRARRSAKEVTLVAVTKSVTAAVAAQLVDAGVVELGESRPQELWLKAEQVPEMVHWHLVGHLQRNKVARTLPLVSLIHSVDSMRLLETIDSEAAKLGRPAAVLLEVNTSGEPQKHGFAPDELNEVFTQIGSVRNVEIQGLMTMAALEDDPQKARPAFASLRELRDRLLANITPPHELKHLSMGMSNDFEVAIEEGATLIRLGTILFEGLPGEAA